VAQDKAGKAAPKKSFEPTRRGLRGARKEVVRKKCAMCPFRGSDAEEDRPGSIGLSKRGTFRSTATSYSGSLATWIENGDSLMPGMKDSLEPQQIKDVVAYVKTL